MHIIWVSVFGLMGLLGLAALLVPAAKKLNVPYTVLLATFGCFLGYTGKVLEHKPGFVPVADFLYALKGLEITSDAIFFIFLPALVFEAALSINVRRLMDDIVPIMFLAVIGLLISTVLIAYPIAVASGMSILVCLLLGAICSATDPVAVVAIFKEVGAPKRLSILVEGESLFNDATAIVAFTIIVATLTGSTEPGILHGAASFMQIFFGGIIIGLINSRIVCWLISLLNDLPLVVITLILSMAYLTFICAEHYFHVSGVMAVVTAALVMGSRGRTVLSPKTWESVHNSWEQISFWANSIIFILAGLVVPNLMSGFGNDEWVLIVLLIFTAFIARAFIIFILIPVICRLKFIEQVNTAYKAVMFWGGLRGAVSLALALAVIENPHLHQDIRDFIGILVTGLVLFTLFINATTIRLVINFFGLGNLSPADIAIRDRATALSLSNIEKSLNQFTEELETDAHINKVISNNYRQRSQMAREELKELTGISPTEWTVIGLTTLVAQERTAYTDQYSEGLLSSMTYRLLTSQSDDLADALKQSGIQGYKATTLNGLDFDWRFRVAINLQTHFGLTAPLSQRLSERFEILLGTRIALGRIVNNGLQRVVTMVGENAGKELQNIIHFRHSETQAALEALRLQYPHYAQKLERRYLEHSAMRREEAEYQAMLCNSEINIDIFTDLEQSIKQRYRAVDQIAKLDIGLDPDILLIKVPLFKNLSQQTLTQLAGLLKPKLALPGEIVIQEGSQGDSMYFISSGVLLVSLTTQNFMLGSGEFFGEIALLTSQPRNASVTAKGFCDLLVLKRKDFNKFLQNHPQLSSAIAKVAQERLEIDRNSIA